MTHDELLVKLMVLDANESEQTRLSKTTQALRAVVELHKPDDRLGGEVYCGFEESYLSVNIWPCPTIQAIIKELQ